MTLPQSTRLVQDGCQVAIGGYHQNKCKSPGVNQIRILSMFWHSVSLHSFNCVKIGWGYGSIIEHRPGMYEAPGLIPRHTHIHIHIHTHMQTHTHAHIFTHTHSHTYSHTCTHSCTHTFTYTHAHIFTHSCTHMQTLQSVQSLKSTKKNQSTRLGIQLDACLFLHVYHTGFCLCTAKINRQIDRMDRQMTDIDKQMIET